MPRDLEIRGIYFFPPIFKIFLGNIERGRRNKMIEDDIVLFAPAELRDVVHVVVVEDLTCNSRRQLV